ncbi:hypothetical protein [Pseudonocardia sp. N23]|uniref:hypothetical protein n=1 Tax=Pseudonocardia sp. N23 TaxID=1987376 RepID=UPI000BFC1FFF|nr:hypothetical protein [Pseudonocardia sp. N23]GAY07957.1 hypothetical protein TOK_6150 [Pseudonocardia sp. N23]
MSVQLVVLGAGVVVLLAVLLSAFRRRARHAPGRARRGHIALALVDRGVERRRHGHARQAWPRGG